MNHNAHSSFLSIQNTWRDKTILILGGNAFIAKTWLSLLLEYVPHVKKIYVLLRGKPGKTPQERFQETYSKSKVFKKIHKKYGTNLENIDCIQVVSGDITLPAFGLSEEEYRLLYHEIDLVINFAADVRFFAPLDHMLNVNTQGILNIVNFIVDSKKAKIIHISTCYTTGMRDGCVPETLITDVTPNGMKFTADEELNNSYQNALKMRQKGKTEKELIAFGADRAQQMGWPNSYTYSKALGELLLAQMLTPDRWCIFRPSIVESTEKHPFPGWNNEFGAAPLFKIWVNYPVIVGKPENFIDVTPADYVAKAITVAATALANNTHSQIYQFATSTLNPLTLGAIIDYLIEYFNFFDETFFKKFFFVNPNEEWSKNKIPNQIRPYSKKAPRLAIIQKVMKMYQPFIYDHNYQFQSENLFKHQIVEKEFNCHPEKIDWREYWITVQLPSLFPNKISHQTIAK